MTRRSKKKSRKTQSHGQVQNDQSPVLGTGLVTQTNGLGLSDMVEGNKKNSDKDKSGQVFTNDKWKPNLQKEDEMEILPVKVLEATAEGTKDKVNPNSPQVRITTTQLWSAQFVDSMLKVKVPDNSDDELVANSATDKMECIGKLKPSNKKRDKPMPPAFSDFLTQLACPIDESIENVLNIQVDSKNMANKTQDNDQPVTASEKLHTGDEPTVCRLGADTWTVPRDDNDRESLPNSGNLFCINNEYMPNTTTLTTDENTKSIIVDSPKSKSKKKRKAELRNECSTMSTSIENGNVSSSGHVYPEDVDNADKFSSPTASIWDSDNCVVKRTSSDKESSTKSKESPRGKKGKKKWSKFDLEFRRESTLTNGVVYEAVVLDTRRNSFVALVGQDIKVLVYTERFKPREGKTFKNVPITCVLKIGDRVKLTAVRKPSKGECGEEWVAEECWQEGPVSARGTSQETQRSTITKLGTRAVQLADGNFALAEVLFLFGFRLAHANVDLMDIFQLGDELMYSLPCDVLDRSGPFKVEKAWFGSLPADGDDKPSNEQQFELMKYLKARKKNMSVITAACGLNKNAVSVKDDFEDIYSDMFGRDIFSKEYIQLPTMSVDFRNNKRLPMAGIKSQHSMDITSNDRVNIKKQVKPAKLENKTQQETISSRKACVASASMTSKTSAKILVDAATQTCVTGDLMCFYTIYNSDDSD